MSGTQGWVGLGRVAEVGEALTYPGVGLSGVDARSACPRAKRAAYGDAYQARKMSLYYIFALRAFMFRANSEAASRQSHSGPLRGSLMVGANSQPLRGSYRGPLRGAVFEPPFDSFTATLRQFLTVFRQFDSKSTASTVSYSLCKLAQLLSNDVKTSFDSLKLVRKFEICSTASTVGQLFRQIDS